MAASPHNSTGPPDQQHQDDGTLTDCTADSTQQPEDEFHNNDEHPEDVLYDDTEENPPTVAMPLDLCPATASEQAAATLITSLSTKGNPEMITCSKQ